MSLQRDIPYYQSESNNVLRPDLQFCYHPLRHTYASNLLANGAAPKDVQELLGHSDVSTTMNVYAHSTRDAKRKSVRLLDKVVGND